MREREREIDRQEEFRFKWFVIRQNLQKDIMVSFDLCNQPNLVGEDFCCFEKRQILFT